MGKLTVSIAVCDEIVVWRVCYGSQGKSCNSFFLPDTRFTIRAFTLGWLVADKALAAFVRPPVLAARHARFVPTKSSITTASRTTTRLFRTSRSNAMPRGVKKEHLPTKTCVVCHRPFTWRKKWEKVWDEVTTCSKSCNAKRRTLAQQAKRNRSNDTAESHPDSDILNTSVPEPHQSNDTDALLMELYNETDRIEDSRRDDRDESDTAKDLAKAARKAAKKKAKAERRDQRQGRADPSYGRKECTQCHQSVDLLIRCVVDASGDWEMVCGRCWKSVSGGVVDGDADHPHYRYGGLWKNRARK